jgi:restriction system protein
LWRSRGRGADESIPQRPKFAGPAVRLSDVPSPEELVTWPAARVRDLTAALFEATGYRANVKASGGDHDLELLRPGHTTPSVLVSCQPGSAGATGVKVVRELFGTLVSTGVASAWIVAPAGFSDDARVLAAERGIELIEGAGLVSRLHALDPLVLTRVLGRVGA